MSRKRLFFWLCLFLTIALTSITVADDANLVGWWRFNDRSGTRAIDSSGNNLHGVLVNDPTWTTGIQGTGLQFTGGSHVAVPGYDGILGSHARTSAAWINVTKTNASIITWGPTGSGTKWVMRTHNNPATLRLECGQGNTYGTTDLVDGEWHHVAAVLEDDGSPDVSEVKLYVDGRLDPVMPGGNPRAIQTSSGGEFRIAYDLNNTGRTFDGLMDDVRIYDRALSTEEIRGIMDDPGIVTVSLAPDPANGTIIDSTWYNLTWVPGDLAVSHQIYISESFDDVNEAGIEPITSAASFTIVGFGDPFPAGLTPGATYYWRVDEVNEAAAGSPWKGDIWSFSVRPKTAWNPVPSDGAMFVDPDTDLSWSPGVGAAVYYVYFADNFEDVNTAEGAAFITETTYDPGPLEPGKTYYWRVDGSDFKTTQRGKVWRFTTTIPGGGLLGEYFNTMDLRGQPVLTRIDPLIDFDYGNGSPEPGVVNDDGFSVRWRGEVKAAFTEDYTFYTRTNDGSRLWIDEKLILDKWAWVNRVVDTRSEPIQLVAGHRYSVRMEWFNEDGAAEAHLLWESTSEPKAIVPAAAFTPPVRAGGPSPANGAVDVTLVPILRWSSGIDAASHDVYFGTDEQVVANATKASPEYKGSKTPGAESYDPGKLAWHTTYYWRIDEVNDLNPDSPWTGDIWSFTTGDFIVVDDFESYNDIDPPDPASDRIFESWIDGFATTDNGALVGNDLPPYTEQTIIHGGRQSMPYLYDTNFKRSEATLTLAYPRDWTEEGVAELSLWFRGYPGSVGSFAEAPAGTYTMTAAGTDIGSTADQFHFAYKMLTGAGSIVARIDSVQDTDGWAKAGVMIRETLEAGSKHAFVCITPENGVASQGRTDVDSASFNTNQTGITAPHWVKLERDAAGNFTAFHSTNGTSWEPVANAIPTNIPMTSTVYVGLALTSHNAVQTCEAKFSNVTISGTVAQQWAHQDVGISSNAPEPLFVALSSKTVSPVAVYHDDANATTINTWTEWIIPLSAFADQGLNLTDIDTISIGLGNQGDVTTPGGSGKIFIDDIRLYRTRN